MTTTITGEKCINPDCTRPVYDQPTGLCAAHWRLYRMTTRA